jgi:hypothetical protein
MISVILTFFIIFPFFSFRDNLSTSKYITLATSIAFSYACLGFLGMLIVFLKLTYIPIFFVLSLIFFYLLTKKSYKENLYSLYFQLKKEIIYISHLGRYEKTLKIFFFILILLFLVSIGPINHSDTANIYVGYPYQFWKNNSHFIDGNLNQGLMGIGDFANIFYFQDKTTWLIRSSQFIPVPLIFMLMLRKKIKNLYLFTFLTSPVFVQWLTIGKNNFLSESCLALAFLAWEQNRDKKYIPNIIVLSLIAISFKISAILVVTPIVFFLIYFYRKYITINLIKDFLKLISLPIVLSFTFLITIFCYRYFLIGNPFYPLFTKIFNPYDLQLIDWEETLRTWERSGFFPLWIFIPKSLGRIAFVLGPANLLIFIYGIFLYFRLSISKNAPISVGISQFILLIFFSQGRADYYMTPLILICAGFPEKNLSIFDLNLFRFKLSFLKKQIFSLLIFIQLIMFLISCFYSIGLVSYVLYDYETGMDKTAYNFYNSRKIEKFAETPVFSEITGMTHLYSNKPFIANQKFERCFFYGKNMPEDQKYKYCMNKEAIKTIITKKDKLKSNPFLTCESNNLIRASRNIFLEEKLSVDFCKLK